MDIIIDLDMQNNALKRREVKFTVTQDSSTVSKADMLAELCKKLSASPDSSIIVRIDQQFGERKSTGIIHIYQDKGTMEKTEPKHVMRRSGKLPDEGPKPEEKQQVQEPKAEKKKGGDKGDKGKDKAEQAPAPESK